MFKLMEWLTDKAYRIIPFLLFLVLLDMLLVASMFSDYKQKLQLAEDQKYIKIENRTYPAWVKYTGNKKNLTYIEFLDLYEAGLISAERANTREE